MQYLLKRTIYETYEYDPEELKTAGVDISDPNAILNCFDVHDGSQYGDGLFGQIDADSGCELTTREEGD